MGAALLMAARIHDGDDITEPDFAVAVQRLAAAHDRIAAQGDIGALVIRRRKRETMRATNGSARKGALRAAVGVGLSATMGDGAGDDAAQTVAVQRGMKISGARAKVGAADRRTIVSLSDDFSRALTNAERVCYCVCVSPCGSLVVSFDGRVGAAGRF